MAVSALDPTFGQRGVALGAVNTDQDVTLGAPSAVAVQADGKIVVVGTFNPVDGRGFAGYITAVASLGQLAARRYNADGTPDNSFGTDGQAVVALPDGVAYTTDFAPRSVEIGPDGSIVFAAQLEAPYPQPGFTGSVVVKLTAAGRFDATFDGDGIYQATGTLGRIAAVGVQRDGKVVAEGIAAGTTNQLQVIRLTTAGALDPTFDGDGVLAFTPTAPTGTLFSIAATGLKIAPGGQIYVLGDASLGFPGQSTGSVGTLTRIDATGSIDDGFGGGGSVILGESQTATHFQDLALQDDGRVVVAGDYGGPIVSSGPFLIRYRDDGTVDPNFARAAPAAGPVSTTTRVLVEPDGSILLGRSDATVARYRPDGTLDTGFGVAGTISFPVYPTYVATPAQGIRRSITAAPGLALTAGGQVLVVGSVTTRLDYNVGPPSSTTYGTQPFLARLDQVPLARVTPGDYDADGRADVAAELPTLGLFAIRPSSGAPDTLQPFGIPGPGQTVPAPGDYDGDGIADVAAYLPAFGAFAIRPSSGSPDEIIPFGVGGLGQSIPAPGDYDGDGRTDLAVYVVATGQFAFRPSGGGPDVVTSFGIPGAGQSIPAPGDYDGDGRTDPALYLPALGVLAYRPASQLAVASYANFPYTDRVIPFGIPGAGQSIPAPGDYDGDGKADVAAYLPGLGVLAYRPSSGGADVLVPFGLTGAGGSIPAPGDYDGDGRTDVAAYLPSLALFAVRPSAGGADTVQQFGATGDGQTVPATSIPYARPATATAAGGVAAASLVVEIPLVGTEVEAPAVRGKVKPAGR